MPQPVKTPTSQAAPEVKLTPAQQRAQSRQAKVDYGKKQRRFDELNRATDLSPEKMEELGKLETELGPKGTAGATVRGAGRRFRTGALATAGVGLLGAGYLAHKAVPGVVGALNQSATYPMAGAYGWSPTDYGYGSNPYGPGSTYMGQSA
jgi:hypothetical protein